MVAAFLFCAVFLTLVWISCAFHFIGISLSGMSFFEAGLTNVLLYVLFLVLPVLVLWAIFGYVSQFFFNRSVSKQLFKLFSQIKKNQDYSDLLARIMLETEQNMKSTFMLNRFDLLVSDMNELLSEFLARARLVAPEQIEMLWAKVQNGGKWSFGKVIIENYNRQPSFQKRMLSIGLTDALFAGTIMEFCARYQTLLTLLEKHDKEKIFLNVIETGVMGKVFSIMAPISDEIRRSKEVWSSPEEKTFDKRPPVSAPEKEKKGFFERLKKPKEEVSAPQKDAFSMALERSFGSALEDTPEQKKSEPVFETPTEAPVSYAPKPSVSATAEIPVEELTDTQKTLDSLKQEWGELSSPAPEPEKTDEELAYPFGGWIDAENYKK